QVQEIGPAPRVLRAEMIQLLRLAAFCRGLLLGLPARAARLKMARHAAPRDFGTAREAPPARLLRSRHATVPPTGMRLRNSRWTAVSPTPRNFAYGWSYCLIGRYQMLRKRTGLPWSWSRSGPTGGCASYAPSLRWLVLPINSVWW